MDVTKYAGGIVLVAVIIGVLAMVGLEGKETSTVDEQFVFTDLCARWRAYNCESDGISSIDTIQESLDRKTLTETCFELYEQDTDEKSLDMCQDVCKNKCNPDLEVDLSAKPHDILSAGDQNHDDVSDIKFKVHNSGSRTVYDVIIFVREYGTLNILQTEYVETIYSGETYEFTYYPEEELAKIVLDIDPSSASGVFEGDIQDISDQNGDGILDIKVTTTNMADTSIKNVNLLIIDKTSYTEAGTYEILDELTISEIKYGETKDYIYERKDVDDEILVDISMNGIIEINEDNNYVVQDFQSMGEMG